jgi:hypothetical protein
MQMHDEMERPVQMHQPPRDPADWSQNTVPDPHCWVQALLDWQWRCVSHEKEVPPECVWMTTSATESTLEDWSWSLAYLPVQTLKCISEILEYDILRCFASYEIRQSKQSRL